MYPGSFQTMHDSFLFTFFILRRSLFYKLDLRFRVGVTSKSEELLH